MKKIIISISFICVLNSMIFANGMAPYVPDTDTLHLYHFDGDAADAVTNGAIDLELDLDGINPTGTIDMALTGYAGKENVSVSSFTGVDGAFTFEALIQPTGDYPSGMIIAGENYSTSSRAWQLKPINNGTQLQFIKLTGDFQFTTVDIPATGDHVYEANNWYHVAVTYNGDENTTDNLKIYWTKLDSGATVANLIGSDKMTADLDGTVTTNFSVGNELKYPAGEPFDGLIDEVRISSVARTPDEMNVKPSLIFLSQPSDVYAEQSQTATFQVEFTSETTPSAQWFKVASPDDILMDSVDPDITVSLIYDSSAEHYTSELSIDNLTVANTGDYYCRLNNTNNLPRDTQTAELKVVGLVAHWSLDQADFVGNEYLDSVGGYDATAAGVPVFMTGADGQLNGAVQTHSENGWATVPEFDPINGSGEITVSFWANWMDGAGTKQDLQASRYGQVGKLVAEDGLRSDTKWQHICVAFDGSIGRLYVDGSLYAEGDWALPENPSALLNIGIRADGSNAFQGGLDDIRIYNYALDTEAVAALYGGNINLGFEAPVVAAGNFLAEPTDAGWLFSGSGISANDSAFTAGNDDAPEGTQVAFLQGTGTISQTISKLILGENYDIVFAASQRQNKNGGQPGQTFDVTIDGLVVASYEPDQSSAGYTDYTSTFKATDSSHTLAFIGTNLNGGDNTAFLDNVRITSGVSNGDLTIDGKVDMLDMAELSRGWLSIYSMDDLVNVANDWLK